MNKDIYKAIMDRTRLRHKFLRSRSIEDRNVYNKQRDYCVSLMGSSIKDVRTNLGILRTLLPPAQAIPPLVDHSPALPLSMRTQGWHYLKHCNL